jgi:hypothetical protein
MTALTPWTQADKDQWFKEQTIQRSYADEVVSKIRELGSSHKITQYGTVTAGPNRYPVFLIQSSAPKPGLKTVLITGGVHGYETSGVHGALAFMKNKEPLYRDRLNFVCAPCISPWSYETINRWNPKAIDPNRSFKSPSPAQECELFLNAMAPFQDTLLAHFDLHETTDTDNTVFRPALQARDGKVEPFSEIPDGFYTVGDSDNPCPEFQAAIIQSVRKVTHIAAADANGNLIGDPIEQEGVVNYPLKKISLCAGFSNARYTTTTEVYPDSPRVTPAIAIDAQVAAIVGGLEFILSLRKNA